MSFAQRTMIAAAAALGVVASAGPATAHVNDASSSMVVPAVNFSASWPVTITGSQRSNGTGCLTLSGRGSSGAASLVFGSQKYTYGSFLVSDDLLVVTITEPLYGQNGAIMFINHTRRSHIGQGIFENVEGGSNFDFGNLAYGMKNGC